MFEAQRTCHCRLPPLFVVLVGYKENVGFMLKLFEPFSINLQWVNLDWWYTN